MRIDSDMVYAGLSVGVLAAVPAVVAAAAFGLLVGAILVVVWVLPWALGAAWSERPSAYGVRPRGRSASSRLGYLKRR